MTLAHLIIQLIFGVTPGPAANATGEADAIVARGLEMRRAGNPQEALELFERAAAMGPSPRRIGNLGIVEATLQHWVDAEQHLSTALASPDDPWVRKNRPILEKSIEQVRTHIGQLVFTGTPGASVRVAGRLAGTLPDIAPTRVAAGDVLISASRAGSKQWVQTIPVQPGMQTAVKINLEAVRYRPESFGGPLPTAVAPVRELHRNYSWKTYTGAALIAAGVAAIAWGTTWVVVDGTKAGGSCRESMSAPCVPVYDTKTPGWLLLGAGVAAAGAGAIVLYEAHTSGTDITVGVGPSTIRFAARF